MNTALIKEEEEEEVKKEEDEADDFLAKFGGASFDALVEGSEPNAACSRIEQEFEGRLEHLAENPADGGQEVEEQHAAEADAVEVPPWRCIPAATAAPPADPRRRMQTPKADAAGSSLGSLSIHHTAEEVQCRPQSGPSGFNYGPGTGEHSMHEGKAQRFFDNGHLAFLMIDLHSRMRRFLNL